MDFFCFFALIQSDLSRSEQEKKTIQLFIHYFNNKLFGIFISSFLKFVNQYAISTRIYCSYQSTEFCRFPVSNEVAHYLISSNLLHVVFPTPHYSMSPLNPCPPLIYHSLVTLYSDRSFVSSTRFFVWLFIVVVGVQLFRN